MSSISLSINMSLASLPADFNYKYIFLFDNFSSTTKEQAFEGEEYSLLNIFGFSNFN